MKHQKKFLSLMIFLSVFSIVVLVMLSASFVMQSKKGIEDEKKQYLIEVNNKNAMLIEVKVQGLLDQLNSIAAFIGTDNNFTTEASFTVLKNETKRNDFKRMGYIIKDGTAITTDNVEMSLADRNFFSSGMQGEAHISERLIDKADGETINVLSAPIYNNNEIIAVLFGTKTTASMAELLNLNSFGGQGYSYVIEKDGTPVIFSLNEHSISEFNNFFEELEKVPSNKKNLEQLKLDMESEICNTYLFNIHGVNNQVSCNKIGINDWYMISLVDSRVISKGSTELIGRMIAGTVAVAAVAIIFGCLIALNFKRTNKLLKDYAFVDLLTGNSNWTKFEIDCNSILPNCEPKAYAIIDFDIKKFKVFNATYNFSGGNLLLKYIANILSNSIGEGEYFSRIAADSFCLLIKHTTDEDIVARVDKIAEQVSRFTDNYRIRLSFGICIIDDPKMTVSALHDCAIIAKQTIKHKTDIQYAFYDEPIRNILLLESDMENNMSSALSNEEFHVYLQPKYLFANEKIVGAEALVRWIRPGIGLVPPDNFIPLFEKNGFIKKLDLYMFEQVCKLLSKWEKEKPEWANIVVSVNISRISLNEDNLVDLLLAITNKYNLPCNKIELELTESAVFNNSERLIDLMEGFKKAGFILSIDDFGIGYSSLNALKDLPVDIIKLDKAFFDDATDDERAKMIVWNLIEMMKSLSLKTVAEGVETPEQVEFLKDAGCDVAQGYFYARPMPINNFEELLGKQTNDL